MKILVALRCKNAGENFPGLDRAAPVRAPLDLPALAHLAYPSLVRLPLRSCAWCRRSSLPSYGLARGAPARHGHGVPLPRGTDGAVSKGGQHPRVLVDAARKVADMLPDAGWWRAGSRGRAGPAPVSVTQRGVATCDCEGIASVWSIVVIVWSCRSRRFLSVAGARPSGWACRCPGLTSGCGPGGGLVGDRRGTSHRPRHRAQDGLDFQRDRSKRAFWP